MKIKFSSRFEKTLLKCPAKIRLAFEKKLTMFFKDPFNPTLNNHELKGVYKSHRSINITGDWRAIYTEVGSVVIFEVIGTHKTHFKTLNFSPRQLLTPNTQKL